MLKCLKTFNYSVAEIRRIMNILRKLKNYLFFQGNIVNSVNGYNSVLSDRIVNEIRFHQRYEELSVKALAETEPGVTNEYYGESEIIVSLTTHGNRIYDVHAAIESIMQGSMKPNKIVLWISEDYRDTILPLTLQRQMNRGLEIKYCRDIRSYTKLIYSLESFPNASIITIDDDILYPYDLLEHLINAHIESPDVICANWIRETPLNLDKSYMSILRWPQLFNAQQLSNRYFFEGFAGVLYPPHSLDTEVFNESTFMDICKYADDVWFNAMALKAGTKVKYAWKHYSIASFIDNTDGQCVALQNVNNKGEVLNDMQIKAVYAKYSLWNKL